MITRICSDCLKSLQTSIEFKELCCKTQKTLSEYIKQENPQIDTDSCFYKNDQIEFKNEKIELKIIKPDEEISMNTFDLELSDNISEFERNFEQLTPQIPIVKVKQLKNKPKKTLSKSNEVKIKLKKKKKSYPSINLDIQCELCGKTFNRKYKYNQHIDRVHKGILEKCKICDKDFLSIAQLRRHMAIHLNERKYKCNIENCDRAYNDITSLRIHFKTHSDEKKYVCEICSSSFKHPSSLRSHKFSHSKIKKLECEECGQGFNQPYRMREHIRIHTGEKPLKCTFCDMMFRSNKQLRPHIVKCHKLESK